MSAIDFATVFTALTGNNPFPWQWALYHRFEAGDIPSSCSLPTGLGKTCVIPIWLIALANSATRQPFPRRLVYVVNRRTVVDQATREAEKLRTRLLANDRPKSLAQLARALSELACDTASPPLAISTLRGQYADNDDWWKDPARPAIIVGTIDMIGSRLLFSGYGAGFKYRPLYAGFLGQDSLIVHDEAHLEPAFQCLLTRIEAEQNARSANGRRSPRDLRPVRVMELTATSRGEGEQFHLTKDDMEDATVKSRIEAKRGIAFFVVDDEKKTTDKTAERALHHKDSGQAILVFLRKLEDVEKVEDKLRKAKQKVQLLTGTIRGYERDRLLRDPNFMRLLPVSDRPPDINPAQGTVYLICTSAGEVGVNISGDHLVCDLTPLDSMAQRLGRVNRFGAGDAQIDIVHPASFDEKKEYEIRRHKTLDLLRLLPQREDERRDACPARLAEQPADKRREAFTPLPDIWHVGDILFDAWALTSIRGQLPGRPPVADWLHGVEEHTELETHVAWREEVELLQHTGISSDELADLLDDYPLKPHELLRGRTDRVAKSLQKLAQARKDLPVWVVSPNDELTVLTLEELANTEMDRLVHQTIILPPSAGGLTEQGMLCGTPGRVAEIEYDVADNLHDRQERPLRERRTIAAGSALEVPAGMHLVRRILLHPLSDDEPTEMERTDASVTMSGPQLRLFFVRARTADDQGSMTASAPQDLHVHQKRTEQVAQAIASCLNLPAEFQTALTLAARWHDQGKRRAIWQRAIGNHDYPKIVLAKSGRGGPLQERIAYRHEFGSLIDIVKEPGFQAQSEEVQELVLHLIAAHHGRARPHFTTEEAFDPQAEEERSNRMAQQVSRRYARLQRSYGRWGLAWLESLVRAADAYASANPDGGDQ
ncbi:MAG TPA: type I-U CRISPR-associated helicase/endonuclease Cas3 [Gemmataceae bacterium]|jgi:CRISPR-associated endonuclease/helicase Cas3